MEYHYSPQWNSQPSYIFKFGVKFKIVVWKLDHKYLIRGIAHKFKIVILEASHTYNLHDFAIEFKIATMAIDHKFHIDFLLYH